MGVLRTVRDGLRAQLWPLPTFAVLLALLAGVLVPRLDGRLDGSVPGGLSWLLFGGDAGAARTVADAVGSSMITVTSLTFSLTVVTLQLASSQFSPRLLRSFTSDLFVQVTLALFLATFTYSLTVLRSVRSSSDTQTQFVPRFAVSLCFLFAVACVIALVLFLAHLTSQIRVETMVATVHRDATRSIDSVLTDRNPDVSAEVDRLMAQRRDQVPILSEREGFLTWLELDDLLELAREAGVVVFVTAEPGAFLVRGTPIGYLRVVDGDARSAEELRELCAEIARQVHTGRERTGTQDISFGLRQLTDVTNKALSPGINDPTTAIHALGHVSALLCDLSERQLGPGLARDDDDRVRVVLARPGFAELVELAIGQPRRYGGGDTQVVRRLFVLLQELSMRAGPDQQVVVLGQLERLRNTVAQQDYDAVELAGFETLGREVEELVTAAAPSQGSPVTPPIATAMRR